jgi:hypothetical protein
MHLKQLSILQTFHKCLDNVLSNVTVTFYYNVGLAFFRLHFKTLPKRLQQTFHKRLSQTFR